MRVPIEWLYDYVEPHMDAHTLAQRLALTGTEVERVEHHGVQAVDQFVVGHVLERLKHPDADRLSVCMVDIGRGTPSQIVCGAPNVGAGQTVAVARPGAIMPDGKQLQRATLRGQSSDGMILAEDEVAIGTDHNGIMVLADGIPPGTPLAQVLPIETDVLVLEITPNRPDCLGIYGIAREVHAATGAPLAPPPWETDPGSQGPLDGVEIVNAASEELCPRFTARILDGVTIVNTHNGSLVPNMRLTIQNGKIAKTAPAGVGSSPDSAHVVAAHGKSVVPGYNDLHAHPLSSPDPEAA